MKVQNQTHALVICVQVQLCNLQSFLHCMCYITGLPVPIVAVSVGISHESYRIKGTDGSAAAYVMLFTI